MKPIQQFTHQKGGQQRATLSALKKYISHASGGDEKALLFALFQSRFGREHSSEQAASFEGLINQAASQSLTKWKRIALNIRNLHSAAPNSEKRRWASLVAQELTFQEMRELGFEISQHGFALARKHARTTGPGVEIPRSALRKKKSKGKNGSSDKEKEPDQDDGDDLDDGEDLEGDDGPEIEPMPEPEPEQPVALGLGVGVGPSSHSHQTLQPLPSLQPLQPHQSHSHQTHQSHPHQSHQSHQPHSHQPLPHQHHDVSASLSSLTSVVPPSPYVMEH